MSAPPPPAPGSFAYHGETGARPARAPVPPASAAAIADLFAAAAAPRRRQRPPASPVAGGRKRRPQAYARQSDPGLLLTAEQWDLYDKHQALQARQQNKYGHFRAAAMMNRGIW